ncbi:MAG: hypothetical protein EB127_02230 [Alphaproteobacteria bacterium]|nr:hypothetical protein [Alphaproteobacteria bacterium]
MAKAKGMTPVVSAKPAGEELLTEDLRRELEDQPEIKNIIVNAVSQTDIVNKMREFAPASSNIHVFTNPALMVPGGEVFLKQELLTTSIHTAISSYGNLTELRLVCGPSYDYIPVKHEVANPTKISKLEAAELISKLVYNNPKAIGFSYRQDSKVVDGNTRWFWTLDVFVSKDKSRAELLADHVAKEPDLKARLDKEWVARKVELATFGNPEKVYNALKKDIYKNVAWNPAYYAVVLPTN